MTAVTRTGTLLFWVLCLSIALVSWRFLIGGVEATMDAMAYHLADRRLPLFLHIGLAPVALLLLPFQFHARLRARRPALHRWMGRTYAVVILLSGLAALWLAINIDSGVANGAGFGLLALLWLGCTGIAVWKARAGDFASHRRWMIRSAALTFAAVTLRLYLPLLVFGLGLEFPAAYSLVAWLCWVPNLIIAEWLLLPPAPRNAAAT